MNRDCCVRRNVIALFLIPIPLILSMGLGFIIPGRIGQSGIAKPSFIPVRWAFRAVWPTIYLMEGVALSLLYIKRGCGDTNAKIAYILFALLMIINLTFIPVAKLLKSFYWRAALVFAQQILIPVNMIYLYRIRPVCGALFLPYSFWSVIATALSIEIIRLNS